MSGKPNQIETPKKESKPKKPPNPPQAQQAKQAKQAKPGKPYFKKKPGNKPKKPKIKKPDTDSVILVLGNDQYKYDWLVRAAQDMPVAEFKITDIGHSIACVKRTGQHDYVDNDVLRFIWYKAKVHILTGINKIHAAIEAGETAVKGQQLVKAVLGRCLYEEPAKVLSSDEIADSMAKLVASNNSNMHITDKRKPAVPATPANLIKHLG